MSKKLKCVLIGKSSIALNCAKKIQKKKNIHIIGIVSPDLSIEQFAKANGLPFYRSLSDWLSSDVPSFDYLFSIVNGEVLTKKILSMPKKDAINFHDAPLPRYAGVHATSWALMNGEASHGVSWHVMSEIVDAGDIIKQKIIRIAPDDTALTLNMKCYEAALGLFDELLKEVENGSLTRIPQLIEDRTYYDYSKKPSGLGILNWNLSASENYKVWRALMFGDKENDLASCKFLTDVGFFIAHTIGIKPKTGDFEPGTIVKISDNYIRIATISDDIIISEIKRLNGEELCLNTFINEAEIKKGDSLPLVELHEQVGILQKAESIFKKELFWVKQWLESVHTRLPYLTSHEVNSLTENSIRFKLDVPLSLDGMCHEWKVAVITIFSIYFFRITDESHASFGITKGNNIKKANLFSEMLPFNIALDAEYTYAEVYDSIKSMLILLEQSDAFINDIGYRYPELQNSSIRNFLPLPCVFEFVDESRSDNFQFKIRFDKKTKKCELILRSSPSEDFDANKLLSKIKGHILTLSRSISKNIQSPILRLDYLDAKEKKHLLAQSKHDPGTIFKKNLIDHFKKQVNASGNEVATIYKNTKRTYTELDDLSDVLAKTMLLSGVKPKTPVIMFLSQSDYAVIAMLAVLKINAFYVPVDPEYPKERLQFIIKDVSAKLIITTKKFQANLDSVHAESNIKMIDVECCEYEGATALESSEYVKSEPTDLAYIMYTSGTTGRPKGVKITHQGVIRVALRQNYIQLTSEDTVAQITTLTFDGSTFEIWGALLNGSSMQIIKKYSGFSPEAFSEAISKNCTILFTNPSVFGEIYKVAPFAFDKLRVLMVGGEPVRAVDMQGLLERIKTKNLNLRLYNIYGPTENTTFSTYYDIKNIDDIQKPIPIGKSIYYSEAYVLDSKLNLLPAGVPGELYVGGIGVAQGYLKRDKLNKQKFIPHPFNKNKKAKLYRTGDIVSIREDGNIVFIGRRDDQVKIRSIRVELKEIETWLITHESVDRGVVLAKKGHLGQDQLVAYVVPKGVFSATKVQNYLKKFLPDYMVPFHYVLVDKLQLTSNQKIDISKLPEFQPYQQRNYQPGVSEKECFLINVWESVLKIENIGRNDNYFSLGGDSIIAMQIVNKINQGGWEISASDIFHYPILSKLAKKLKQKSNQRKRKDNGIVVGKVPLGPIQTWFFERFSQNPNEFSQYTLLRFTARLDKACLENAMCALINHHDILRSEYQYVNRSWEQIVRKYINLFEVLTVRLASESVDEKINEIEKRIRNDFSKFDLENAPLIKCILFSDDDNDYLVILVHHLIIDGVSWRILLEDLFVAYDSYKNNDPLVLPMKTTSFKRWSEKLHKYMKSKELLKQKEYWLKEASSYKFPIDFNKGDNTEKVAKSILTTFELKDATLTYKHVRPLDILVTALVLTLLDTSHNNEVSFFIESHGRENFGVKLDMSRTLGWFTSMYPMKITAEGAKNNDIINTLKLVRKKIKNTQRHGVGFGLYRHILNDSEIKQKFSDAYTTSLNFNFLGQFDSSIDVSGDRIETVGSPIFSLNGAQNCRIGLVEVTAWIVNNALQIEWKYSKNHHRETTIKKLSAKYMRNINALLNQCRKSVTLAQVPADFPLISLNQSQLERCLTKYPDLENIAELSPLQSGLLFHALESPHKDIYHTQIRWRDIRGLDLNIFKNAWKQIIQRHNIFRTKFEWRKFNSPLQIITPKFKLPWKTYDCSNLSKKDREAKVSAIIAEDQSKIFDFTKAPLMCLSIVKLKENEHMIIWTHHHILLGGWSVNTVLLELYEIYFTLKNKLALQLPETTPFVDYVEFKKKAFDQRASMNYWKKYLDKFSDSKVSNINRFSNEDEHGQIEQISFVLPEQLSSRMKKYANENSISLNNLMLFSWILIVSKYARTKDVCVGLVVSTRANDHFHDNIVGPLVNTLPFRMKLDYSEKIHEALNIVKTHVADITQNCHTSLLDIYHWLKRNTQDALFDSLFVFENYPLTFTDDYICDLEIRDINHYPLSLTVYPHKEIRLVLTYNSESIQSEIVHNILENYCHVLDEVVKNAVESVREIEVLSKNEVKYLRELNNTKASYPVDDISTLFSSIAKKQSNKTAIVFDSEQITYLELDKLSNQWAHYLIENGVNNGDLVAVCVKRSIDMVAVLLAILKTGAAYLPIDEHVPLERLRFILNDANINCLVYHPEIIQDSSELFSDASLDITRVEVLSQQSSDLPAIMNASEMLAYVTYTSGTTGNPKGVQIKRKSVVNLIFSVFECIKASRHDKFLSLTTIGFDISVLEILGSLIWGMELILAKSEEINNPKLLIKLSDQTLPTIVQATPAYWKTLLNAGWKYDKGLKILTGGEMLTYELSELLQRVSSSVWNLYGPTETTIWSSISKMEPGKKVTIGRPLANTTFYVLDEDEAMLPIGVIGELYIGGEGVAKGYLKRPELNKERFVLNKQDDMSEKLFRTGDIVRWLSNGELEYLHRADNQIKLNGFRVELDEIRSMIMAHPDINDCVVLKLGYTYESYHLVAFCILKDAKKPIIKEEINSSLWSHLPYYMIPSNYVAIEKFPLLPSGKVDYNSLKRLAEKDGLAFGQCQLIENPTEQFVVELFKHVLNIKNVGLHDNLFEMGGNSISAIHLLSCIQEFFSVSISLNEILIAQTPFLVANTIIKKKGDVVEDFENVPSSIICLQPKGNKPPLFLIHPIGGTIFWFVKLAKLLGDERPIYCLQDPALSSKMAHFSSFDAMANFYLDQIRAIQPQGPYFLGGASFGANMAVELAKKLMEKEQKIAFVGLLDGWAEYPDEVSTLNFLKRQMKNQVSNIKKKLPEVDVKNISPIVSISWHRSHLLADHKFDWVGCPLTLFKAKNTMKVFKEIDVVDNHWRNHCPCLNVFTVPGNHETMFYEPNVQHLASQINKALRGELDYSGVLPPTEKEKYPKSEWSHTKVSCPEKTMVKLFEEMVDKDSGAIAAVCDGMCITYDELNSRANQFANYLKDLGFKNGDVLGLYIERGFSMLVALMGVLKIGAAYAPIHLEAPENQIETILKNCHSVITEKSLSWIFDFSDIKCICVDRDWSYILHKSKNDLDVEINLSDPAVILHSTISTKISRDVVVSHKNISNMLHWALTNFTKEQLSGVLASTPLSGDLAPFEIFSALCSGGCVHMVNNINELSDAQFSDNISLISTTPSHVEELLRQDIIPSSVETLLLAKENLSANLVEEIYLKTCIEKIFNVFVMAETGILTCSLIEKSQDHVKPSIGKPIQNAVFYILDSEMRQAPIDFPGELYVGGDVLASGYLKNLELTKEKFIKNPFDDGCDILFKTGEQMSWLKNGGLKYLGHMDNKLIVKGFVIEVKEIEKLLLTHPGVASVKVKVEEDSNSGNGLTVYFVPDKTAPTPNYIDLTEHLRKYLPQFTIPSDFIQTNELPEENEYAY